MNVEDTFEEFYTNFKVKKDKKVNKRKRHEQSKNSQQKF